jgi:hypothetical protein
LGFLLQSIWFNAWVNLYQGTSEEFGVFPWYYILGYVGYIWGGAFPFIIALASLGGRRLPLLLAVTCTILATPSLIGHKEYRFIHPALPLVATFAGIGSVELLDALWRALRPSTEGSIITLVIAAAVWGCVSFGAGVRTLSASAAALLRRYPCDSCALGNCCRLWHHRLRDPFVADPGTRLSAKGDALYNLSSESDVAAARSKFNAIVTKQSTTVPEPPFARRTCFANGYKWGTMRTNQLEEPVCIWLRPGTCARDTGTDQSSKQ